MENSIVSILLLIITAIYQSYYDIDLFCKCLSTICFSLTHIALPDLLICLEPRTWLLASIGNEVCIPCPGVVLGILKITDWLHFAQLVSSSKVELPHPGTKGQLARVVGKGLVPKYFSDSLGQIQMKGKQYTLRSFPSFVGQRGDSMFCEHACAMQA